MDVLNKVPVREQEPKVRATNFDEVCLGYNKDEAVEEASRCIGCKNAKCIEGCPVSINIPGFIAEVKSKNGRAMCLKTRWTQYVQRIDNSLGPYSQGPHFVLDYAYPPQATTADFPGDNYSGYWERDLYQKFELYLINDSNSEIIHTIHWSNTISIRKDAKGFAHATVILSVL